MNMVTDPSKIKIYQLEVTSVCNLKCSFCARDKGWAHREQGHMDLDLIDMIDWSNTGYTELQLSGEPTLHPELPEIVKRIKAKGVRVGLSTNSTRPNVDLSEVDVITNTLDKEREKTLVEKYGDKVFIQHLGIDWPYEDTTHTKPISDDSVFGCVTPFQYVTIHYDGDVVPCCKAFGKQHVFGNLYDQSMAEILKSKKRHDFLEKIKSRKKKPYICKFCTAPNPHKIHEKLLNYLETGSKDGYGQNMRSHET